MTVGWTWLYGCLAIDGKLWSPNKLCHIHRLDAVSKLKENGMTVKDPIMEFDLDKTTIKDSGNRTTFVTGAERDVQHNKGFFHLLSDITLTRLAIHMERGAIKYGPRNWEQGIPLSSFYNSAIRHALAWLRGDTDEDHAAAWLWNIHGLIHTEELIRRGELPSELNDVRNVKPLDHEKRPD